MKPALLSIHLATLAAVLLHAGLASAGAPSDTDKTPVVEMGGQAWSQPLFGGGVKTSDVYTDGHVFITVPLWSTLGKDGDLGGDYLFLEPYSSLGEQGEVATSLGLSWRHLFSHEPVSALKKQGEAGFMEEGWFLGANVFVDMLDTQHNNNFWQMGVGAEVGTRFFEVRGNYYIPMTGEKLYDRSVNTQSFTSSSSSTVYNTVTQANSTPFASGNSILQGTSSQTFASTATATSTTTVRTVTELFEKGMEGWDAEASVLVPWLDQWMDLRIIGGYLSFNNQPFGPADGPTGPVHGWKAGAELRPVPAVVLGGMWYEDKRFIGSNWLVSAELQIPMDKTWKDAFKVRRRHLVEHLAEPVHRQNDAIKVGNREDQQSTSTSQTSVQHVTRVVSQTATNIVLKDDIVFVNHGGPTRNGIQAGSAAGNGTAEHPTSTIQSGANLAQASSNSTARVWNVYTQGTTIPYVENISVTVGSVNFIGSGRSIAGRNGKSFGTGSAPTVMGDLQASNVGFLGVTGYQFIGTTPGHPGIGATDVGRVVVTGNTISNAGAAGVSVAYTVPNTTGSALISANSITGSAGNGIEVFLPASGTFTVSDNVVSQSTGSGITFSNLVLISTVSASVSGNNVSQSGGDGINIIVSSDSPNVTAVVTGNAIADSGRNGINLSLTGTAANTVTQSGGFGITVSANGSSFFNTSNPVFIDLANPMPTSLNASISANAVTKSAADGIAASLVSGGRDFALDVSGNTVAQSGGRGVATSVSTLGSLAFPGAYVSKGPSPINVKTSANGNVISDSQGDGLVIFVDGAIPTSAMQASGNVISRSGGTGLNISSQGTIASTSVNNNTISGSGGDGLVALLGGGLYSTTSTFNGNNVSASGGNGMKITVIGAIVDGSLSLSGNTIDRSGGLGLNLVNMITGSLSGLNEVVAGNRIGHSGGDGFRLDVGVNSPIIDAKITGNVISDSTGNGLSIQYFGNGPTLTGTVSNNVISNSGGNGLRVDVSGGSPSPVMQMTGNTITNSGSNGISLSSNSFGSSFMFTQFDLNTVTGYKADGVLVNGGGGFAVPSVNGTLNTALSNTVGPAPGVGFFRVHSLGTPQGSFYLNGVQVNLPSSVP